MVSTSVIHVNSHLSAPEGRKAELAWLADS